MAITPENPGKTKVDENNGFSVKRCMRHGEDIAVINSAVGRIESGIDEIMLTLKNKLGNGDVVKRLTELEMYKREVELARERKKQERKEAKEEADKLQARKDKINNRKMIARWSFASAISLYIISDWDLLGKLERLITFIMQ